MSQKINFENARTLGRFQYEDRMKSVMC